MEIKFSSLEQQFVKESRALLPYLQDEAVTDVLIQGNESAFIEREGALLAIDNPFSSEVSVQNFVERLVLPTGKRLDARQPYLDGALCDGSRFHVILPPIAVNGPHISIRKLVRHQRLELFDFAPPAVIERILRALNSRQNVLISGGTGAGKTTLLTLLMEAVDSKTRWVVIEESREINTQGLKHVARLEGRPVSPDGVDEVSLRVLIKNALRMRPDRIVLGECRGPEAFDMLQAMSTGHGGSMGTIHASYPLQALTRFESLVQLAGIALEPRQLREWIGSSIGLVVHLDRLSGRRQVAQVIEICGVEGLNYRILPLFQWDRSFVEVGRRG